MVRRSPLLQTDWFIMQDRADQPASVHDTTGGTRAICSTCTRSSQGAAEPQPEQLGLHRRRHRERDDAAANRLRSTSSRSGRGCCATSARSMRPSRVRPQAAAAGAAGAGRLLEIFDPGRAATWCAAAGEFGVAHMLSSVCSPASRVAEAAPDALRASSSSTCAATMPG